MTSGAGGESTGVAGVLKDHPFDSGCSGHESWFGTSAKRKQDIDEQTKRSHLKMVDLLQNPGKSSTIRSGCRCSGGFW